MAVLTAVIVGILSYLVGSLNFSIILSKAVSGEDIRKKGSGNAGATNMLRTHGKKLAVITLILDVLKGVACVAGAMLYVKLINSRGSVDSGYSEDIDRMCLPYIAGVCVVLGHNFPLYFGFRGGKGVATSLGVVMMLDWKVGLIVMILSLAIMAVTRYVSLGSILGGAMYVIIEIVKAVILGDFKPMEIVCVLIIGGLLILRHHANIKRLINGTENKLGGKK